MLFSCYALSKGNPIEDAKSLFRQLKEAIGDGEILGLGITGYGKDLLKGILGADCGVVETIAHASAGLITSLMRIAFATWAAWTSRS